MTRPRLSPVALSVLLGVASFAVPISDLSAQEPVKQVKDKQVKDKPVKDDPCQPFYKEMRQHYLSLPNNFRAVSRERLDTSPQHARTTHGSRREQWTSVVERFRFDLGG